MKIILIKTFFFFSFIFCDSSELAKMIINNTEKKFKEINDYQVNLTISISIPAFRMPKKNYTVFFKQPDKVKIKSRGFGLLPRTGMFTSPLKNFDNLTNIEVDYGLNNYEPNIIILKGNLIVDSLAVKMPNDYARLTFKPTVSVKIDTSQWVIKGIVTKIDTIKLIEINNIYDLIDGRYFLPVKSTVEYFIKDARFSRWIQKDLNAILNNSHSLDNMNDMVKGQITVLYNKYKINRGLKDAIFN